jgi:hypothetical protein
VDAEDDDRLVIAMRHAARSLTQPCSMRDLETTLAQIVASAVDAVPGVEAGSISMTEHEVHTRHPTSEDIGALDDIQGQLQEGPSIHAIFGPPESGIVVAADLAGADCSRRSRLHRLTGGNRPPASTARSRCSSTPTRNAALPDDDGSRQPARSALVARSKLRAAISRGPPTSAMASGAGRARKIVAVCAPLFAATVPRLQKADNRLL